MQSTATKRPRDVDSAQAAAILYGDWGTSKAYVIGLAFALSGYSSVWLILAISALMGLVGWNYITICEYSPSGGGVYTSARKRSEVLALISAFFLIADYLITASLSALSCFEYLGVSHPGLWAMVAIAFIGLINFFGPRHSANLAIIIGIATFGTVVLIAISAIPFIGDAVRGTQPLPKGEWTNWANFVGIIVAMSGIEAVANTTGVMKLDPGSTDANPSVYHTAKKAILMVMFEVCIFTAFFGFMMNALPGLTIVDHEVNAPDQAHVRDQMLKYMGGYFIDNFWGGPALAYLFSSLIGVVFAVLLLSAVNTALVALISLMFVMSRDGELPQLFEKLTPFGVPKYPLIAATLTPIVILFFIHDVAALANLYAVGFVGAIVTNLGVNASDKTIPMKRLERLLMWIACIIMLAIEITLFVDKPDARRFVITVMAVGLVLRMLVIENRQKAWATKKVKLRHASLFSDDALVPLHHGAILCAIRSVGKTLNFAIQEAVRYNQPLYILFIREQKVITEVDRSRLWVDDDDASKIFDYAKDNASTIDMKFFYSVSDNPARTIVEMAEQLQVSRLILGKPRHSVMLQVLRGNVVQEISEILPENIDLIVLS
jgi:amino acid transporter